MEAGPKKRFTVAAAWLLLIWGAFAYRTWNLTRQSLWPDEVYSLDVSKWSLAETWTALVSDHVPLYTIVLGGWRSFAGSSEFSLRYLSVICATLAVSLAIVLARRLLNSAPASYVAGFFLAISPFQLYYAQEVVTYAFLGAVGLLSSWVFLRWVAKPPWRVLLLEGLLYAALAYTHYSGLFVPATHVAIFCASLVLRRIDAWQIERGAVGGLRVSAPVVAPAWAVAWVGGGALFMPWFLTHLTSVAANVAGGTSKSLPELLSDTLIDLTYGYAVGNHLDAGNPIDANVLRNLTLVAVVLVSVCLVLALLPRRRGSSLLIPWAHLVALLHTVVPYGLLFALVQATREFSSRYGFPATLWLPIAMVAGLWYLRAPIRWLGVALFTCFSLWGGLVYIEHPGFYRLDFRAAASYILDNRQPGDVVVVTAPYVASTFDYYSDAAGANLSGTPLPATIPLDEAQTRSALAALGVAGSRVWRLRWQADYADPSGLIAHTLEGSAMRESERNLGGGLAVELWLTRPPVLDTLPASARPVSQQLANRMRLVGYDIASRWPGTLAVTLFWSASAPLEDDYTVFLHLVDQDGHVVANGDARPYDGRYPTTRWPAGKIVRDLHEFQIDPCTPPGAYQIETGLYVLRTMQRLGSPGSDAIRLTVLVPEIQQAPSGGSILTRLPAALRLDERLPPYGAHDCRSNSGRI